MIPFTCEFNIYLLESGSTSLFSWILEYITVDLEIDLDHFKWKMPSNWLYKPHSNSWSIYVLFLFMQVRIWNVDTGSCLAIASGHMGAVGAIAFSKKRKDFIVSGSLYSTQHFPCTSHVTLCLILINSEQDLLRNPLCIL